jgi:aminoglycoside phosphotransferase (APT) family kinase protein
VKQGRASSVTDLGNGTILRYGGHPAREAQIMELAQSHAFPVPRIHEVRPDALVLERIAGPTMGQAMARSPWEIRRHVRRLAELHERLHAIPFDGGSLLHFDLHPDNVILSPDGPVLIDWTNAHGGDPEADVAMTWVILETSAGLPGRVLAWLFRRTVGRDVISRGLPEARAYRLRDPNVTGHEKDRVARL